jgi:inosose dehydratase
MTLIGCGQLTWQGVGPDQVMREIAEAGYDGAPGGLNLDVPAAESIAWFGSFGLQVAPPYYSASFWDPAEEDAILAAAVPIARYVRDLGCRDLYVAANGGDYVAASGKPRRDLAGQVGPSDGMTGDEFAQFGKVVGEFARITLAEGVASCFHNHVGTVIETADELGRLLDTVPGDALYLGLDTGHIAWAGDNATAVCDRYHERIRTLHLKDVDDEVRSRGVTAGWTYSQFTSAGVFAELGEGMVDFPSIVNPLLADGFDGWLIVETDVTMKATAFESARISREYLTSIGL